MTKKEAYYKYISDRRDSENIRVIDIFYILFFIVSVISFVSILVCVIFDVDIFLSSCIFIIFFIITGVMSIVCEKPRLSEKKYGNYLVTSDWGIRGEYFLDVAKMNVKGEYWLSTKDYNIKISEKQLIYLYNFQRGNKPVLLIDLEKMELLASNDDINKPEEKG